MMFKNIAFLALATASAVEAQTGLMAGLYLRSDVDDFKVKDLVQNELEKIMENEECDTFDEGKKFYFASAQTLNSNPSWINDFPNGGGYLLTIPTYGLGNGEKKSEEFVEYTKWTGNNNNFHKQWVNAAFKKLDYSSGELKADLTNGTAFPYDPFDSGQCVGYEEVVKKVTSYVYNFIEAMQLCQKAIELAKDGCPTDDCSDVVENWEAAAAIYIGSLEGEKGAEVDDSGGRSYGKSNYALADKRCRNFKTCGPTRDADDSKFKTAPVNTLILGYFAAGTQAAFAGDYALMTDYKKLISAKAAVPWIQGTLRYTWRLSAERTRISGSEDSPDGDPQDPDSDLVANPVVDVDYSELDKEVGEAAAFAIGSVAKLWACSKKAGELIWPQVEPGVIAGRAPVNFQLVKTAFECNYKCLNTSCDEVGSLRDGDKDIKNGAKTCNDAKLGTGPTQRAKCSKIKAPFKNKCKPYTGKPGVKKRDKPEYFATELP